MATLEDIKDVIAEQANRTKATLAGFQTQLDEIEKKAGRPRAGASTFDPSPGAGDEFSGRADPQTKAFFEYMRTGREPDTKSMSGISDPDGGYLVPVQLDSNLTKYLRAASAMRQIARVVPVESAEFKQPHSTGGTAYSWVGETAARPETTGPGFKMVTIPTHEVYANPAITQNLLDDNSFDLGNWLVAELGDAFGDAEGDAFINGNGVARPRGLFTYDAVSTADATRASDKFQYVATGAAGAFHTDKADALIKLVYSVKAAYRQNAGWLMSPEVLEAVRKMKLSASDQYVWTPSLSEGQPSRLLGYPVFEDENIPAIAANSLSVAFGDFSRAYTITDRGTAVLRDPFSNKPFIGFYSSKRVGGGGGRDTRAVKFLKFSAS
ncbi:MAG: phage major capsid protein [Sulfuritalea sp.]|nr:phage major capsid protein [Sulfuritalea sp.]